MLVLLLHYVGVQPGAALNREGAPGRTGGVHGAASQRSQLNSPMKVISTKTARQFMEKVLALLSEREAKKETKCASKFSHKRLPGGAFL